MQTQTINDEIHQTLENIYDFIKNNEKINEDFIEYTKTLGIYGASENKNAFLTLPGVLTFFGSQAPFTY